MTDIQSKEDCKPVQHPPCDAFQERLDRVLKRVPSTTGTADDISCHGNAEIPHDAVVITLLLETTRANYLTSNEGKFVFKTRLSNVIPNALSRVSPQPVRESKVDRDVITVHMFTEEIHADTESIADFQHTTADDMISGLLMQAVINGWPDES
ncbi:unnamed protein product [Porites lobata]|uniref:Uncharacterized protein n=1 Tax=Porites lobata TaxID=104759 RepID=A0ABN8SBM9_9CNID|nr:unnamed protein product [Porites lobata]